MLKYFVRRINHQADYILLGSRGKEEKIMSHGPATEWKEDKVLEKKKSRLGITLFFIYTMFYVVFIFINVTNNELMRISVGSLNVAIVFGFTLIISAFILAWFYNLYCTKLEKSTGEQH